jgi:N-acetylmuramoyl-L-alanine amidase
LNVVDDYLTVNPYSRPAKPIQKVKGLVVHWTANPGKSAKFNRDFFESKKSGNLGYGSAHYIIDGDPEDGVICCIPPSEIAYHVGATFYTDLALKNLSTYPNNCTIGVELCPVDWAGNFSDGTYQQAIELFKVLIGQYSLNPATNIYRHYDITGKDCPHLFVTNPECFADFKQRVGG